MCNRFLKTYVHTTGNDSISKSREKLKTLVFNLLIFQVVLEVQTRPIGQEKNQRMVYKLEKKKIKYL